MNIQYPNITGKSSEEQLLQIRSYLFRLVEQLNMESESQTKGTISESAARTAPFTQGIQGNDAENAAGTPGSIFNQIKSLIIKSADIVEAYSEEIEKKLEGHYVASSEFGEYKKDVTGEIAESAESITAKFSNLQKIEGAIDWITETKATIRSGALFDAAEYIDELKQIGREELADSEYTIYGIEIGQTSKSIVNGQEEETFSKFARFTSYGMTLYGEYGNLVAWFTDTGMHIPRAKISDALIVGGFQETVDADGGTVERWVRV